MEEIKNLFNVNDEINSSLKKAYKDSLKEESFKEFVSKINLPDEVLMKYTSSLEESSKEYNHCKNCKNILGCQNKIRGYAYLPKIENNKLVFNYRSCKLQEKLMDMNRFKSNITLYQTKDGLLDADIKKIYMTDKNRLNAIEWLVKFKDNYPEVNKGIYLHGSFGSGKSYLVTAILVELAKKDIKSTIIFWPEFLRDLKSYFGSDIEYKQILYQVKNTNILFIDDIGAENLTSWARDEVLGPILQYRMDNGLITMFSSNLNMEELESHLSITKEGVDSVKARRIIERVKNLTDDIELVSKNLRN